MGSFWLWGALVGVVLVVGCWFVVRERLDPGYLAATWDNDVAGRMGSALDQHHESPVFYVILLLRRFEPAMFFLPLLLLMLRDGDQQRRNLCLLMVLAAASWLGAITAASTKLYWYAMPMQPLLAIAVGIAASSWLVRPRSWPALPLLRGGAVALPILVALVFSFWYLNVRRGTSYAPDPVWYGPFMAQLRTHNALDGATIVDGGLPNAAGFSHYNPIVGFFMEDAARRGEQLKRVTRLDDVQPGANVLSCDPEVRQQLAAWRSFTRVETSKQCVFGRLARTNG